jgi:uncharacterized phage protein (TIGR02218 family)
MTKSASAGLIAHLGQPRTNLATCWKLARTDGTVLGFTDHDQPLAIDADGLGTVTYRPVNAFSRSAIGGDETMDVDELEVVGVLDSADISAADLSAGRYDDAEVRIFLVNWTDLSQGVLKLRRGWLGEVRQGDFGYTAELMGLMLAYQRNIVELISPRCLAELGDGRCQVVLEPTDWQPLTAYAAGAVVQATVFNERRFVAATGGVSASGEPAWDTAIGNTTADGSAVWRAENSFVKFGTVTGVTSRKQFRVTGMADAATGYFDRGLLTFTGGQNLGVAREVRSWNEISGGEFEVTTFLPFPFDVAAGSPADAFKLTVGCNKTVANCQSPFDNIVNFRGFPFVPGQDDTLKVEG